MPRMTCDTVTGLTNIGYRLVTDAGVEDTPLTPVVEGPSGCYAVTLPTSKVGLTLEWYRGAAYLFSEPVTAPPDNAGIATLASGVTLTAGERAAVANAIGLALPPQVQQAESVNLPVTQGADFTTSFAAGLTGTADYRYRSRGVATWTDISLTGTDPYVLALTDAQTAAIAVGVYEYRVEVTAGSETRVTHSGLMVVSS